jgi:fumarate reductase flavoprotein subunit
MYKIMTSGQMKQYKRTSVVFDSAVFALDPFENFEEAFSEICTLYPDLAWEADSATELAQKVGLPEDVLIETIERYNHHCKMNYDEDFCKPREHLVPMSGEKYYAVKYMPSAYGTLGGIKINHKLQVLTQDWKVIEGLYGAGSDVCEIYNGTYYFYFPGNTMGFAVNTGRMAGNYAADYIQSLD